MSTEPKKTPENDSIVTPIKKPSAFSLDKFKSKRAASIAGIETLTEGMPHMKLGECIDFFRTHPDDEYWSGELCFVSVPVKGAKTDSLHLIDEDLAMDYLPSGRIKRFRLVLGSKPYDVFVLFHVPTQNLDNGWNSTSLQAVEQARTLWTSISSRKEEGIEAYKVDQAKDLTTFPDPNWPKSSLEELIGKAFAGKIIDTADHPGLLRLIGAKQNLK